MLLVFYAYIMSLFSTFYTVLHLQETIPEDS